MSDERSANRRTFLRTAGRTALAFGLGGGIGALALKGDGTCPEPSLCRGCARFEACELPVAVSLKRAEPTDRGQIDG